MKPLFTIKALAFTTAFCVMAYFSQAQWPLYRVYQVKGHVKLIKPGSSRQTDLSKNAFIYSNDRVALKDADAELVVFDRDTNYIQIRKDNPSGIYGTKDIDQLKKVHIQDNLTIKYFSLLWEDLFKPKEEVNNELIAHSTGGVSRGGVGLMVCPREVFNTSMDKLVFRWRDLKSARYYRLSLRDESLKICYQKTTPDTSLLLNFNDSLQPGHTYHWTLEMLNSEYNMQYSTDGIINWIDEAKTLPLLSGNKEDSLPGSLQKLVQADYYEKSGCTKKAWSLYKELLEEDKDDRPLKKLYHQFLIRNYLEE